MSTIGVSMSVCVCVCVCVCGGAQHGFVYEYDMQKN